MSDCVGCWFLDIFSTHVNLTEIKKLEFISCFHLLFCFYLFSSTCFLFFFDRDDCNIQLVEGRKYGLCGRNGIGKTCLINSICRHEIEKFPKNIHVLQVEQECPSDDTSVLDHILNCDVERSSLLAEMN